MDVPFFRPAIDEKEIEAVVRCLRSGWLTTGPLTRQFEQEFALKVGARHAVAVNSCTAALHLALEAVGLRRNELVLVPTMTFAATAEVVRYFEALPVFVDADASHLGMDLNRLEETLVALKAGRPVAGLEPPYGAVRAVIPMHYGGQMLDMVAVRQLAERHRLAVVEDAAHALPAYSRPTSEAAWQSVGSDSDVACFSFYANKCITTGEGGMAVTDRDDLAERMRVMSLHGMSKDAWKRFTGSGSWYYEIIAPGYKYNLTDIASAIGLGQLARMEELWDARRRIARRYLDGLHDLEEIELPRELANRQHAWHLFQIQLRTERLSIGRDRLIHALKERGIVCSVHWMPLHLQPYYVQAFGYRPDAFPVANEAWQRLISLPIFPGMTEGEQEYVIACVRELINAHRRR